MPVSVMTMNTRPQYKGIHGRLQPSIVMKGVIIEKTIAVSASASWSVVET